MLLHPQLKLFPELLSLHLCSPTTHMKSEVELSVVPQGNQRQGAGDQGACRSTCKRRRRFHSNAVSPCSFAPREVPIWIFSCRSQAALPPKTLSHLKCEESLRIAPSLATTLFERML